MSGGPCAFPRGKDGELAPVVFTLKVEWVHPGRAEGTEALLGWGRGWSQVRARGAGGAWGPGAGHLCWGRSQDCPWVSACLLTPPVHESPGELTVIWGGGGGLRSL